MGSFATKAEAPPAPAGAPFAPLSPRPREASGRRRKTTARKIGFAAGASTATYWSAASSSGRASLRPRVPVSPATPMESSSWRAPPGRGLRFSSCTSASTENSFAPAPPPPASAANAAVGDTPPPPAPRARRATNPCASMSGISNASFTSTGTHQITATPLRNIVARGEASRGFAEGGTSFSVFLDRHQPAMSGLAGSCASSLVGENDVEVDAGSASSDMDSSVCSGWSALHELESAADRSTHACSVASLHTQSAGLFCAPPILKTPVAPPSSTDAARGKHVTVRHRNSDARLPAVAAGRPTPRPA